jgi:hypothetical protein
VDVQSLKQSSKDSLSSTRLREKLPLKMNEMPTELEIISQGGHSFSDFLSPVSFRPPERLVTSGWLEHAPFAFWLIEQLRPNVLVELGTYLGFSFCAFCQAIRMAGLSTAAFAVDHWTGDDHGGFYGEEVYQRVEAYCRDHYSDISTLLRMAFPDALQYFEDGSIDLLHIDGRHYLEDVRADFESWRPKLSECAVVLFHDINVRQREFGAHQLWRELCEKYHNFSFIHGNGLGILGTGKNFPPAITKLFAASGDEALRASIRSAYARLGMAVPREGSEELIRQRDRLAAALEAEKAAAATATAHRDQLAAAREAENATAAQVAVQRDQLAALLEAKKAAVAQVMAQRDQLAAALEAEKAVAREAKVQAAEHARAVTKLTAELEAVQLLSDVRQKQIDQLSCELTVAAESIAGLSEGGARAQVQIRTLRDQLVDAEAARAKLSKNRRQALPFPKLMLSWSKRRGRLQLESSGLFDAEWYLRQYPDVAKSGLSPVEHYLEDGYLRGYRPNPLFDTRWYLEQNDDVRRAGVNPLLHYIEYGCREGRNPGPEFNTNYYLKANPDVRERGMNPLVHYLLFGGREGRLSTGPSKTPSSDCNG